MCCMHHTRPRVQQEKNLLRTDGLHHGGSLTLIHFGVKPGDEKRFHNQVYGASTLQDFKCSAAKKRSVTALRL